MVERSFRLKNLLDNALLAIGCFVAGYIGISLAVPPGFATVIWPASGVALCALLVRGGVLWPGVWLGSFSFSVVAGSDSTSGFSTAWPVFAIAACMGIGATIQALAGARMARQFSDGLELSNIRQIARATILVIALPCMIAPTIGAATLLFSGALEGASLPENWRTWYFGNFLGVLLIVPILLLSQRSPIIVQWHGSPLQGTSSLVAMSLATTVLLTFYAWNFLSEREYNQAEAAFVAMAEDTDEALRHRLQIYQRALESGAAFVAINGSVTPPQWREYVEQLQLSRAYPGMRGFGMFEYVSASDLPAFQETFAREYGDRFAVHPQVERERHFVINRIEPLDHNLAALGLDLAFEEGRREAIAASTESEEPVLTRPIVLVQDEKQGAGFLLMLPILDEGGEPTGKWVYSPLIVEELLAGLTPRQGDEFALEVYYGEQPDSYTSLFSTGSPAKASKFDFTRTIELAGQPITLRWASLQPFERRTSSSAPILVLVSGLLITALLGLLLTIFLRRENHVVRKVDEATAELAERNRMLEMAEATAHIGHWHFDPAEQRLSWSDEVFRLHGLTPGSPPDLERAIDFYHPDDRGIVEQHFANAVGSGESYQLKARLVAEDRKTKVVEVIGSVDTDDDGQVTAVFGVIIDRTDEMLMRHQLTEALEEARAADTAKSSFLANMSHEIRTPMNGVIGFTELALSEENDPAQRRRLTMIADSGSAMLRLLNDLLDFAKIEAKQMAIISEPTDLRHTLRSCQRLMEPVAQAQKIPLLLTIDPALPSKVVVDKMRFRQIVLNLVGNALKFTMEGEVKISVSVEQGGTESGKRIKVIVQDTGIGIAAERLDTIFERFTQADNTTARRFGGTGLGLPISAELAALMGGELRADSLLGVGSSFILTLPLEESTAAHVPQAMEDEPSGNCGHAVALRILVAEDNPVNQELTIAMVEKAGHDCDLARNGREAVDSVLEASRAGRPYDMVLMDMQMPEMDGLEATRAIREAGCDAATLPILAVTANAYADDKKRCEAAGMQAHLGKPLRLKALCDAIDQWSSQRTAEAPAPTESAVEWEISPRLATMFEERKAAAIKAIEAALDRSGICEGDREEIASLLHQIAGVAAYFNQSDLGESCRSNELSLLESEEENRTRELLRSIRGQLAGASSLSGATS